MLNVVKKKWKQSLSFNSIKPSLISKVWEIHVLWKKIYKWRILYWKLVNQSKIIPLWCTMDISEPIKADCTCLTQLVWPLALELSEGLNTALPHTVRWNTESPLLSLPLIFWTQIWSSVSAFSISSHLLWCCFGSLFRSHQWQLRRIWKPAKISVNMIKVLVIEDRNFYWGSWTCPAYDEKTFSHQH